VTGDSIIPFPRFGHGPEFGYFYYGTIWYGDEMWNNMLFDDLNGDGMLDDVDRLRWDTQQNQGRCFRDWETFQHPQLGEVEIGGFNPKYCLQNPPTHLLAEWVHPHAMWNLALAQHLPLLELEDVEVSDAGQDGDARLYDVTVRWTNTGRLPTALRQAQLVRIVQEDRARLEFDDELTGGRDARVRIIDPVPTDKTVYAGFTQPGETAGATFRVRVAPGGAVEGTVRVLSTRGGTFEVPVRLGG
jgi:hypothetical protein